jgi:glycosyltransferase involved in cell wall biosynthesis
MKKFSRILITVILPDFNLMNRYSAVASVVYSFASLLKKDGFDVYINDLNIVDWESNDGNFNKYPAETKYRFASFFSKKLREFVKDVLAVIKIRNLKLKILKNPRPDLIISWITYRNSFGVDFSKIWNVPLVSIYDNPIAEEYLYLKGFYPILKFNVEYHEKRSVLGSNSLIVYSNAVKDYLDSKYSIKCKIYFKAFTDFKRMEPVENIKDYQSINFGYIGSFFNWHKLDDLIEAFQNISNRHSNCKLYLIGDGPEFERIKAKVNNTSIILTGKKDGSELANLIKNIHVGIISNSLWFHAPVKFFQYSATKLVVLSKKTPTILELSCDHECFLFFDSKQELEQSMEYIINNSSKIDIWVKQSSDFIKDNYSENAYLDFFYEIFENIQ